MLLRLLEVELLLLLLELEQLVLVQEVRGRSRWPLLLHLELLLELVLLQALATLLSSLRLLTLLQPIHTKIQGKHKQTRGAYISKKM